MNDRYACLFQELARKREGAFVPFAMLGDPGPDLSRVVLHALAESGADALELGLPFSDPVADGPVIQAAAGRALRAGLRRADCWELIAEIRREYPTLPVGILAYANLVFHDGPDAFCRQAARAGVDALLIPDLPLEEADEVREAGARCGVHSVFILPPDADENTLGRIAAASRGFTYVTTRAGVTGADRMLQRAQAERVRRLRALAAAPPLLGFGIARPMQVRAALELGAAGAISGSAVVALVERYAAEGAALSAALAGFVREMKAATRQPETEAFGV